MDKSKKYWLALSRIKGIERIALPGLMERFSSPEEIFSESGAALNAFSTVFAAGVKGFTDWDWVDKELASVEKHGAVIVAFSDPGYPEILRNIHDPPCLLYVKGAQGAAGLGSLTTPVAVVGTRRPTHYGLRMAESISTDLAAAGVVVVSGMARGCDAAAHKGALKGAAGAGGAGVAARLSTVAVVGTGVDVIYPRENTGIYDGIVENGLVVSEFPMSTPHMPYHFPRRNRIISGLSKGVVVIEAPTRSGALMTAEFSLDYSREVFAVPGRADSAKSAGTNALIRDGALLVGSAAEVLVALGYSFDSPAQTVPPVLDKDEGLVWAVLADDQMHIDGITEQTGLSPTRALGLLLEMELKGYVEQLPGKSFLRKF